jgi:hypothetical protein
MLACSQWPLDVIEGSCLINLYDTINRKIAFNNKKNILFTMSKPETSSEDVLSARQTYKSFIVSQSKNYFF